MFSCLKFFKPLICNWTNFSSMYFLYHCRFSHPVWHYVIIDPVPGDPHLSESSRHLRELCGNGCWSEPPLQSNFTVVIWTPLNLHAFLSIIARYMHTYMSGGIKCMAKQRDLPPFLPKKKKVLTWHKIRLKCNIGCLWVEQSRILHILYDVMYDILICKCWCTVPSLDSF